MPRCIRCQAIGVSEEGDICPMCNEYLIRNVAIPAKKIEEILEEYVRHPKKKKDKEEKKDDEEIT